MSPRYPHPKRCTWCKDGEVPDGRVTTATVLFCDLVGSTAQRTKLGDDAADRVALSLDLLLRDAVARNRGSVVKGTGDGLMAVFDAASDALNAAVAAHQAIEHHNRTVADLEHLVVRMGVSAGDVHFVAHDCHGTPVVEAARLEAAAEPNSIFVSGLARSLAGSRGGHQFEPVGLLELKGLARPVETFRVPWTPAATASSVAAPKIPLPLDLPLPPRLGTRAVFVGRDQERSMLRRALLAAGADGHCRVEIVSGEPGIGKTSLAAAFAHDAVGSGAVVLYGRCGEDRSIAYQPWLDALAHLCHHAPQELLRDHVEARGGELARFIPELAARVDLPARYDIERSTEQYLLFGAVVDLLARVAERAPLVLVLDDLHWADTSTLVLLKHFVAADGATKTLVVANYRDSDVTADHPFSETLASLYRAPGVERVPLDGLGPDAILSLLEHTAGHELAEDGRLLRDALLAETDGNPFFVTETLRHLAETGTIAQDTSGRWAATGDLSVVGLPVTVREVIRQRVARLGPEVARIMGLASVIGREFDLDVLVEVAASSEDVVLDVLEAAISAAIVHPVQSRVERFGFAHALIEHTIYDELLPARRRRAHRRVAEALASLLGDDPRDRIGELARHWIAADPDGEEALDYAVMAGQHAMHRLAPPEAVGWFREALRLLDRRPDADAHRRCALLVELGVAQRDGGDGEFRSVLLEAARLAAELDDATLLVDAALANTRGWASTGAVDQERVEVLQAAIEAVGTEDSSPRARLLATLAAETSYASDWRERLALSDQGLAVARRVGDDDALSYVLARRAHSIWVPDMLTERLSNTRENLELASRSPNPSARFWAAFYRIVAVTAAGEGEEIDELLATLQSIADDVGLPLFRWEATTQRACRELVAGRLDEADHLTHAALRAGTMADQPDAEIVFAAGAFLLRLEQGRLDETVDVLAEVTSATPGVPGLRASLALAYCDLAHDDHARALLLEECETRFAEVPYDQFWLVTLTQWGLVTGQLRESAAASALTTLLAPWAEQMAFTGAHLFGSAGHTLARCEATLGRYDDADRHFAGAMEAYERLGAPAWGARAPPRLGRDAGEPRRSRRS